MKTHVTADLHSVSDDVIDSGKWSRISSLSEVLYMNEAYYMNPNVDFRGAECRKCKGELAKLGRSMEFMGNFKPWSDTWWTAYHGSVMCCGITYSIKCIKETVNDRDSGQTRKYVDWYLTGSYEEASDGT